MTPTLELWQGLAILAGLVALCFATWRIIS